MSEYAKYRLHDVVQKQRQRGAHASFDQQLNQHVEFTL